MWFPLGAYSPRSRHDAVSCCRLLLPTDQPVHELPFHHVGSLHFAEALSFPACSASIRGVRMTTDDLGIPDRPQTKEASRGAGFPLVPASVKGERVKRLVRLTSGHFSRREARNGTPVKSYLRQERTVADPVRCENLSLMGKKRPAPRRRGSWDQRLEDASRKIGARVKVILETREIPQARLAEHLNVGENHVSGLLSGAKRWNLPLFLGTRLDHWGSPGRPAGSVRESGYRPHPGSDRLAARAHRPRGQNCPPGRPGCGRPIPLPRPVARKLL
jgi:hypothetical protein